MPEISKLGYAKRKFGEDQMQRSQLLGLILALVCCVGLAASLRTARLEKPSIKSVVGGKFIVADLLPAIAEHRVSIKMEALRVEISGYTDGSKALQAVVDGSADLACGAYARSMRMAIKGRPVKAGSPQASSYRRVIEISQEKVASYGSEFDFMRNKVGVIQPEEEAPMLRNLMAFEDVFMSVKVNFVVTYDNTFIPKAATVWAA